MNKKCPLLQQSLAVMKCNKYDDLIFISMSLDSQSYVNT